MEIFIGCDHAGYDLKQRVKEHLAQKNIKCTDLGTFSTDAVDYPDITREVCEKVLEYPGAFGIMICGTGQGSAMTANRFKKIRAALCNTTELAKWARSHNYANMLCLGARTTDPELALGIVDTFLETPTDPAERHQRRVDKMDTVC